MNGDGRFGLAVGAAGHGDPRPAAAQPGRAGQDGGDGRPDLRRAPDARHGRGLVRARVRRLRRALQAARADLRAQPRRDGAPVERRARRRRTGRDRVPQRADAPEARPAAAAEGADRRLCRPCPAPRRDALRRLADLLLHGRELRGRVGEDPRVRRGGGPRPRRAGRSRPAPDLRRGLLRGRGPAGARLHRRVLRPARMERVERGERDPRDARAVRRAALGALRGRRPAHLPVPGRLRPRAGRADRRRGPAAHVRRARGGRVMDKRMELAEAAELVRDGDTVVGGGCLYSRSPYAMLFELLRAGRRDLTLARNLMCYEAELFLARGAAARLMASWVGIGLPWGIPRVFRRFVEADPSIYEEWSHLTFGLRFLAGSMGVPFLPTASLLGSDLLGRIPAREMSDPFTGEKLVIVPACEPDVALIHAHRVDTEGNAQVEGPAYMDLEFARAARTVIVTAEEVV